MAFKQGEGCQECNYSGYRGRVTIAELWMPSHEDALLITKNAPFDEIRASARRSTHSMVDSMRTALEDVRTKLEELVRVMPYPTIVKIREHATPPRVTATA